MTLSLSRTRGRRASGSVDPPQTAQPTRSLSLCGWLRRYLNTGPTQFIFKNPQRLIGGYVRPGMTVLDIGCGTGFYTLPMARRVSPGGKVVAVDDQPITIARLMRRVEKAGLVASVVPRLCAPASLELAGFSRTFDFALACAVLRAVPDRDRFFSELRKVIVAHGQLLIVEPHGSCPAVDVERVLAVAEKNGFQIIERSLVAGQKDCTVLLAPRRQAGTQLTEN